MRRSFASSAVLVSRLAVVLLMLAVPPVTTSAVPASAPGPLAAVRAPVPGQSGLWLVETGKAALTLRDALVGSARERIDAQYYIWNSDASGRYLAARLLEAAGRGVRVRVLLDDVNVAGRDAVLASLAAHPNVEVRLYNPTPGRAGVGWWLSFVRDFGRLNRRMHNKALVVDGSVAIVGGRNIGDEYFDLAPAGNFRDRDVLVLGSVAVAAEAGFAGFWASSASRPIEDLVRRDPSGSSSPPGGPPASDALLAEALADLRPLGYEPDLARDYLARFVLPELVWAPARLVVDPPPSAADQASVPQAVARELTALVAGARSEVLVESAYFILGDESLAEARRLRARGVRLRAITNSLASNDLVTNHSGYARRRPAMLAAGIELHELRPDGAACAALVESPARCGPGSRWSLHSKSLVVDQRWLYVGSFNLNLRSAYLNSESALIVDSPVLAARVAAATRALMAPDSSWLVRADGRRGVRWETAAPDGSMVGTAREPDSSFWRRAQSRVLGWLPLEKYL